MTNHDTPEPGELFEQLHTGADPAEQVAVGLLAAHGLWLARPGFVEACVRIDETTDPSTASIDWDAAICQSRDARLDERIIVVIAAELAGVPTGTRFADLCGELNADEVALVIAALAQAPDDAHPFSSGNEAVDGGGTRR